MSAITFDSLTAARDLREKGIPQEHADAIANAIRISKDTDFSHLATKEELNNFKSELRADFAELKGELKTSIAEGNANTIKWVVSIVLGTGLVQTIAVIYTVLSIVPKLH